LKNTETYKIIKAPIQGRSYTKSSTLKDKLKMFFLSLSWKETERYILRNSKCVQLSNNKLLITSTWIIQEQDGTVFVQST